MPPRSDLPQTIADSAPIIREPSSSPFNLHPLGAEHYLVPIFGHLDAFNGDFVKSLFDRAIQRLRRSQERTVFVVVWLNEQTFPIIAERVVTRGTKYSLAEDVNLRRRLSWSSANNQAARYCQDTAKWDLEDTKDRVWVEVNGSYEFYREVEKTEVPLFEDLLDMFITHYRPPKAIRLRTPHGHFQSVVRAGATIPLNLASP